MPQEPVLPPGSLEPSPPRLFPQGGWVLVHILLFLATLYTTTLTGALVQATELDSFSARQLMDPAFLAQGLPYSLCLLTILGVHEMGHYLACRWYGVAASLPYFIPSIPFPIGTFGAFIRIRAPIPNRNVLFDIGVAGPIAGFVIALPVLVYGILTSQAIPMPETAISIDEPLILIWLSAWLAPPIQDGYAVILSGPLMAGWVGCLATAINLFPVGQLDGGHVCYAVSARFHRISSFIALIVFVVLGLLMFPGWLFFATLLVMFGPRHPPVVDGSQPLSRGRMVVAALSFLILIVCFIPRPFPVD